MWLAHILDPARLKRKRTAKTGNAPRFALQEEGRIGSPQATQRHCPTRMSKEGRIRRHRVTNTVVRVASHAKREPCSASPHTMQRHYSIHMSKEGLAQPTCQVAETLPFEPAVRGGFVVGFLDDLA